jgi:NAD(P)-dependent dehydrogenase (short-subunit alcohol dehydrogenase family)
MKIALITGASRGLGRSTAEHLSRAGWGVIGTYRTSKHEADTLQKDIEATGGSAVMLQLDTGLTATFAAFSDAVGTALHDTFGRDHLDALINNAGSSLNAPFAETTEEQFDEVVDNQLKGPFFLTQRMLPTIADHGHIVNISSGLARFSVPGYAVYAATKGAIEVLTRYQAKELGHRGIRVNVVAPGAIATDFEGGVVRDNPDANRGVADTIALGRVGLPDDIGAALTAVLSDRFAWANGSRIELSGGQNL